jgi:hypothetical protein
MVKDSTAFVGLDLGDKRSNVFILDQEGGIPRHPVDNPSACGSSLIAYEILSKQPEPPLPFSTPSTLSI